MAKRKSTRRKALKPKFIEVEGHQLTEAMYAEYERCLKSRGRTNASADPGRLLKMGLDDFLSAYRPSRKIEGQLHDLFNATTRLGLAIGALQQYPFFTASSGVRAGGCDLLKKLALDLYYESAKLTTIAGNVEAEERTKLQHWLEQDEQVARIGRGAEVAHG